jgi:nitrate reductase NapE component
MSEDLLEAQKAAEESRVRRKPDLTLFQAVTMSVVAILAVAVGTVYGTILF